MTTTATHNNTIFPTISTPAGSIPVGAPNWNRQRHSQMPSHRYADAYSRITVPLADDEREWPRKRLTSAPLWVPVDLRDGNQALAEPMDSARKRRSPFTEIRWTQSGTDSRSSPGSGSTAQELNAQPAQATSNHTIRCFMPTPFWILTSHDPAARAGGKRTSFLMASIQPYPLQERRLRFIEG